MTGHVFCSLRLFNADGKVALHLAGPLVNNALIVHGGASFCRLPPVASVWLPSGDNIQCLRLNLTVAVIHNRKSKKLYETVYDSHQIFGNESVEGFFCCSWHHMCLICEAAELLVQMKSQFLSFFLFNSQLSPMLNPEVWTAVSMFQRYKCRLNTESVWINSQKPLSHRLFKVGILRHYSTSPSVFQSLH